MSDVPFGFSNRDDSDPDDSGSGDSGKRKDDQGRGDDVGGQQFPFGFGPGGLGGMFGGPGAGGTDPGAMGGFDPAALGQMLTQFGQMLSGMGNSMASGTQKGPVDYGLAKKLALQQIGSATPIGAERTQAVADSVRLAELWLDDATTLPAGATVTAAWTPADWLEHTMDTWQRLCDPVAEKLSTMWMGGLPEEAREMAGPLLGMVGQMGGFAFGSQLGQALGQLSKEVLTSTDIGLPLGPAGTAALMPEAIAAFGEGLDQPQRELVVFLAAREAAHHRLFSHVPWLRQRVLATVEEYARGISVDFSAMEEAAKNFDPSMLADPSALENILQQGAFEPQTTPEQKLALERLETLLALIEGWVSTVVSAALGDRLPGVDALSETLRRRRASGGPAEQTFATLVGLELRPRKMREAAALWTRLAEAGGIDKRDGVWAHPDLLPDGSDLDDPAAFIDRVLGGGTSAFDDPIAQLLRTEAKEAAERERAQRERDADGGAPPGDADTEDPKPGDPGPRD
ncbi:zinc-dependent metalloprotease [Rhodococcus sp. D2-41]|uniref:zinc-dependent metalloprotease n=1 Tax=Speluncibacter jeojiensis TaxID=2710754 RepID=UPI00240F1895|nr:zinc-dependent metalloprotease [Rhodococcus sp. D2-41]MDG3008716.1 zinc-dependent metalloprotease [Rhodococcus sp. D2-41]